MSNTFIKDPSTGKKIEVTQENFSKWYEGYFSKKDRCRKWIIEANFPMHINHTQDTQDIKYLGALFLEEHLRCSCGEILIIDRGMEEEAAKAVS